MTDPRERKKATSRAEPEAGLKSKGARPAPPTSGEAGGNGFLEQLRQRLAQAPAAADAGFGLDDLDGAESEAVDLVGGAGSRHDDSDDDDFEPTVLLQSPDLMSQVRKTLREEEPAVPIQISVEEPDTPQYWNEEEDDTVSQQATEDEPEVVSADDLDGASLEPLSRDEVETLTGEFEELLEEDLGAGDRELPEDEMTMSQAPPVIAFAEEEAQELESEWSEDAPPSDDLEEQTMVGGAELPIPPMAAPPKSPRLAASLRTAEPIQELPTQAFDQPFEDEVPAEAGGAEESQAWYGNGLAPPSVEEERDEDTDPDAKPFEARLEEYLADESELEVAPVEALEMSPDVVEDQEASFEERLEARLLGGPGVEAGTVTGLGPAEDLHCPSCGHSVEGLLAQRLLELTSSVEMLRAEVRALSERLGP
jgi:hypothetical protein